MVGPVHNTKVSPLSPRVWSSEALDVYVCRIYCKIKKYMCSASWSELGVEDYVSYQQENNQLMGILDKISRRLILA